MSKDFSQYIGHAVTLRKPEGDEGSLLVLEVSDLALFGLDIDLNLIDDMWTVIRLPVAGTAGVYKILDSRPAPRLLADFHSSMRQDITKDYMQSKPPPLLLYKASVLELVTTVQKLLSTNDDIYSGPFDPTHDFSAEIAETQTDDGSIKIDDDEPSDDMHVCLHIPTVINKEALAKGVHIFVQCKPRKEEG